MGGGSSQEVTKATVTITKDVNMNDYTDEYRCCKEEYRLPNYTSSSLTSKSSSTKRLECNDKLIISPSTSANRIVRDKLDYYLRDI